MRKVKNNIQVGDPSDLFAQGVKSLVDDLLFHPSQNDQLEIEQIQRSARQRQSRGNLFNGLLRQFSNL